MMQLQRGTKNDGDQECVFFHDTMPKTDTETNTNKHRAVLPRHVSGKNIILLCVASFAVIHISSYSSQLNPNFLWVDEDPNHLSPSTADAVASAHASESESADALDYAWIGMNWVPPKGAPIVRPSEMLEYFRHRNVLFIGDSLTRRQYATLYGMMTAPDLTDIKQPLVDSHCVINFSKCKANNRCELKDRSTQGITQQAFKFHECRDLPAGESDLPTENQSKNLTATGKKGRFDHLFMPCYRTVAYYLRPGADNDILRRFREDYDLIVIGQGAW
eukprot:CAMPEP_0194268760 /NCGR_PEP_ID=MMETSP0169-20130528/3031_1 /TAXON_ID=218684 /ORGANISM="Corethron pennatum, Strain L29A3" /LENGTH=274 /DNA_ID=CAMNT_0039010121 /DNA_START=36 /DNA_END=857 /DNA_ORIENTATION=+